MEYYHSKNSEIRAIVDDPMKVGLLSLGDIIEDVFAYNYSHEKEHLKNLSVHNTVERLTAAIMDIKEDDKSIVIEKYGEFTIEPFGSSVNSIYMHSKENKSDLDLSINFHFNPAVSKEEVLNDIIPAVHSVSGKKFELVLDSKVPIFKYTDQETGEECDLGVNGVLGAYNSKLIKTYLSIDKRVHKMAYFIKFWMKHWRLIGADNGYLSSYAVQIMMIAF